MSRHKSGCFKSTFVPTYLNLLHLDFIFMTLLFIANLSTSHSCLLIVCVALVCVFETINGFHDTANAVATVIYTRTLKATHAVIWSGIFNFIGVLLGGLTVALGIMKLVPLNDMMAAGLNTNIAMVLAILITAIIWNLGTWYYGIPCSSSHTLIGALIGAGLGFATVFGGVGPNWQKAQEIGLSLLFSPLFGFALSILLMYLFKVMLSKNHEIFNEPKKKKKPALWISGLLVFTCTAVSYFHGNNDGQKGVGLLLVVLIAFLPAQFALNPKVQLSQVSDDLHKIEAVLRSHAETSTQRDYFLLQAAEAKSIASQFDTLNRTDDKAVFVARKTLQSYKGKLQSDVKSGVMVGEAAKTLTPMAKNLSNAYEFAPLWTIIMIALCLGIGTMIGWKRIVVTIGSKIGKSHLNYAQGASAELCAATTIGLSSALGLPVSTTHVLSSGIAGSMVAKGGIGNLQRKTIKNIAMAWVLTLPVTLVGAFCFFFLFRLILGQ
jgi:inorganic phosphate transporter, PiT family